MAAWLKVFEGKALAEALTASGYAISEKTVQRWKKGQTKPKPQDITAIKSLLELDIERESAPGIPERLDEIELLIRAIAGVSGVNLERVEEMHRELLAAQLQQRRGAARQRKDATIRDE